MLNNTMMMDLQEDPRFVTALARGLVILKCFDENSQGLTHQQICEKTKLPKATVSRLLFTLMAMQFVSQDEKGNYYLGKSALKVGNVAVLRYDIAKLTHHLLKKFAEKHRVSVNIAIHQGGMMRYVACYRSPMRISVNLQVGSQVPVEKTAIGRAFYACSNLQNQQLIKHYLAERMTQLEFDETLINLNKHEEFYQKQQFALSDGDYSVDILAVAVAILPDNQTEGLKYAINASVPNSQWHKSDFIDKIVLPLQRLAKEIQQII